jgi:ribonucleases P/MRP protein subunit RPP40
VDSGVPQGTVMGPPLFTIFIDDIDEVARKIELLIKFADDNKVYKVINSVLDRDILQETLNKLCEWAKTWEMEFNVSKCKILHVGRTNLEYKYYMNNVELQAVEEERDVGVIIHRSLKPSRQCEKAANTEGAVLRLIQRNFHFRDRKIFVDLYKQYVRPHLEFSVPAWSLWTVQDIEKIESVPKKAVKMVSGLNSKDYEDRCREIGIKTLAERRIDQDMAQVYRFHKGSGGLQAEKIIVRANVRAGPVTRLTGSASNF